MADSSDIIPVIKIPPRGEPLTKQAERELASIEFEPMGDFDLDRTREIVHDHVRVLGFALEMSTRSKHQFVDLWKIEEQSMVDAVENMGKTMNWLRECAAILDQVSARLLVSAYAAGISETPKEVRS